MKTASAVLGAFLLAQSSHAGVKEALAALDSGDYKTALAEFTKLAEHGDDKAMISIALMYHQGTGVPQDYAKAMDWYRKAFALGNGDAYNNLGVMYRDGLGVTANRGIAYALFLIVHMRGLGGEDTQYRAGRNLDREVAEQSEEEIKAALCFTEEYVSAVVSSRGRISMSADGVSPSPTRPRLKEKNWWLESERPRMQFQCPK